MNAIVIVLSLISIKTCLAELKLEAKFHWKQIDFKFRNDAERAEAIRSQQFLQRNVIPFGVEAWNDKLFITIPRRSVGVPATLNYIDLKSNQTSPLLTPYPSWELNRISSGNIISTYRVNVDTCDRLWSIDTGSVVNFDGEGETIQSPRIRVFDLKTNLLLREHEIPTTSLACNSIFINIIPNIGTSCEDTFAYAVDPSSNALLVYSYQKNQSWRKSHPYFYPDPFQTNFQIGDVSFQWDDGVFGFVLTEADKNGRKNAIFHPMSSLYEFAVDTEILNNPNFTLQNEIKILFERSPGSQAAAAAYDNKSKVLFYSLVNKNALGCWDTTKRDERHTDVLANNQTTMIYLSDVKVDNAGNLWTISNRVPLISNGRYNSDDINFRIFTVPVKEAIKNTRCDSGRAFWRKIL